jgi:hypothetical protein
MLTSHMVDGVRLGSIKAAHGRMHSLNSNSVSFQRPLDACSSYMSVALAFTDSLILILAGSSSQGKFSLYSCAQLALSFLANTVPGAMRSIKIQESRTNRTSIIAFRRQVIRFRGYCSACRIENMKSCRRSGIGQSVHQTSTRWEDKCSRNCLLFEIPMESAGLKKHIDRRCSSS